MPLKAVKRKGRKYYTITGSVAGRRIYKSAGTTIKSIADQKARKLETELEERDILGPAATMTFSQAVNIYLDAGHGGDFLGPLNEELGEIRLKDIRQADLDKVARKIYPNVKPSTLNRQAYTPFVAVFNWVSNETDLERRWRRPKGHANKTKFRWLWPDEFQAVHDVMPSNWQAVMDLFAGTGVREGEGINLDWLYTHLRHGEAWVHETKTSPERRIELPPRTVATLANEKHRVGKLLLNSKGLPFSANPTGGGVLSTGLYHYSNKAGVEPFSAHVLRHTWATWFYSWNKDQLRLKALGGWAGDEMVGRYTHVAPRHLRDDLARHGWSFDGEQTPSKSAANVRST